MSDSGTTDAPLDATPVGDGRVGDDDYSVTGNFRNIDPVLCQSLRWYGLRGSAPTVIADGEPPLGLSQLRPPAASYPGSGA